MSTCTRAWLLTPCGVQPFAVAEHEVIQYLNVLQNHKVPVAPAHCSSVVFWRNRIVPLVDFGLLTGAATVVSLKSAVLAYQLEPNTPLHYVAIALQAPPARILVDDEAACGLPTDNMGLWQSLAKSCFTHEGAATPIVSISRLCSAEFRLLIEESLAEDLLQENEARSPTQSLSPWNNVGAAQRSIDREKVVAELSHVEIHGNQDDEDGDLWDLDDGADLDGLTDLTDLHDEVDDDLDGINDLDDLDDLGDDTDQDDLADVASLHDEVHDEFTMDDMDDMDDDTDQDDLADVASLHDEADDEFTIDDPDDDLDDINDLDDLDDLDDDTDQDDLADVASRHDEAGDEEMLMSENTYVKV